MSAERHAASLAFALALGLLAPSLLTACRSSTSQAGRLMQRACETGH